MFACVVRSFGYIVLLTRDIINVHFEAAPPYLGETRAPTSVLLMGSMLYLALIILRVWCFPKAPCVLGQRIDVRLRFRHAIQGLFWVHMSPPRRTYTLTCVHPNTHVYAIVRTHTSIHMRVRLSVHLYIHARSRTHIFTCMI